MDNTKPWYASITVWAGALAVVAGAYATFAASHGLPAIPAWITSLLGTAAIYGRVKADTKIG